jgi:hypothetical protein
VNVAFRAAAFLSSRSTSVVETVVEAFDDAGARRCVPGVRVHRSVAGRIGCPKLPSGCLIGRATEGVFTEISLAIGGGIR